MNPAPIIYLASRSPRRAELLKQIGVPFQTVDSPYREGPCPSGADPVGWVRAQARGKLEALSLPRSGPGIAIAADTVVSLNGVVFGKPADEGDARRMLSALSGRDHEVLTGLCVADLGTGRRVELVEATRVFFRKLSPEEIEKYAATGEPMDKAGAYGVQEKAGAFVERVEGDYFNVVGLPLAAAARALERLGVRLCDFWAERERPAG